MWLKVGHDLATEQQICAHVQIIFPLLFNIGIAFLFLAIINSTAMNLSFCHVNYFIVMFSLKLKFVGWKVYTVLWCPCDFSLQITLPKDCIFVYFLTIGVYVCKCVHCLPTVCPFWVWSFVFLILINWHVMNIPRYYPCICLIRMRRWSLPWKPQKLKK